MNVDSFEQGIQKLTEIAKEGHEGQFPKAGVLLQSTVKLYAENVDQFCADVLEFKSSLSKGVFGRYRKTNLA